MDDATATRIERWADGMSRQEQIGKVEPEVAERLAEAGIIAEARKPEDYVAIPAENWSLPRTAKSRLACAASMAAMSALLALPWAMGSELSPICAVPALMLALIVSCAVACDMRAKVIPYQLCALAAPPSIALTLLSHSPEGYLGCAAAAAICTGGLWAFSKVGQAFGVKGAIGMGDLRMLPWATLPLGPDGAVYGALCCFGLMMAWGIAALASQKIAKMRTAEGKERLEHIKRNKVGYAVAIAANPMGMGGKREKRNTYLAMAPGIALWLAAGWALAQLAPPFWNI